MGGPSIYVHIYCCLGLTASLHQLGFSPRKAVDSTAGSRALIHHVRISVTNWFSLLVLGVICW